MATATELLASSNASKSDSMWFDIDLTSREIVIPKQITNLGVRSDADAMKASFRLPRFYGDLDFADCKIGIDYTNAEGEEDRYEPEDVTVDGNTVTFSWIVGRHAAMYEGMVTFGLCIKQLDPADSTVPLREFHTTRASLPILEGMQTCEEAIVEYTDLFEQWRAQLFGEKDSLIAEINEVADNKTQEVLATLPADYTETHAMASQALRTRANAIVTTAEGDAIVANDASDDYLRGMRIYGKSTQVRSTGAQILPLEDFEHEDRGLKIYVEGGVVRVVGTANYTSSFNITLYGTYSSTETVFTLPAGTYTITDCMIANYDGTDRTMYRDQTVTLTEDFNVTWVATRSYGAKESVDEVTYPMINSGSTALPWEPYTGGIAGPNPDYPLDIANVGADGNVVISVYGKNILELKEVTGSGYTTVLNDDGSITVTGAANTTDPIYLMFYSASLADSLKLSKNVKYHLWADTPNGLSIGTKMADDEGNASWASVATWSKYTGTEYTNLLQIYIESKGHEIGDTSLCGTYRIQLEVGDKFTGFEKYKAPQTITLTTANGLPGIPVTSDGNYTDANGQQWICDEIDLDRGIYIQRVKMQTFTGEESWLIGEQNVEEGYLGVFYAAINDALAGCTAICNRYLQGNSVGLIGKEGQFDTYYSQFRINIADYASPDEWKEQLAEWTALDNPLTLVYTLATPIETRLTDAEIFAYSKLHSNYPNTAVLNDSGTWMEVDYNVDTETCFNNVRESMAVSQTTGNSSTSVMSQAAVTSELDRKVDKDVVSFPGGYIEMSMYPLKTDRTFCTLDRYKVVAGKTYTIYGTAAKFRAGYPLAMFSTSPDIAKTNIGTAIIATDTGTAKDYNQTFTPEADGYLFVAKDLGYGKLSVSDKKPLKIQIFGDSMSDKNWNAGNGVGTTRWVDFLADYLSDYVLDVENSAVGGNTLIKHQPDAKTGLYKGVAWQMTLSETTPGAPNSEGYDQYAPLLTDRDLIIVWAGCNEWGFEGILDDRVSLNPTVPLADVDISKLYGAVRSIIETVSTKTNAKLLFVTPVQRYTEADGDLATDADGNPLRGWNGYLAPLVNHVDVIREACAFYGVPCLDMYREGGLNRFNIHDWTFDGLHANLAGAELFAQKIAGAIKNGVIGSGGSYGYSKAQIDTVGMNHIVMLDSATGTKYNVHINNGQLVLEAIE